MNIFNKKKPEDIMEKASEITIKTTFNRELMKISSVNNDYILEKGTKIDIGHFNNILSIVPNVLASKTLSQAYKIVMPNGVTGNLMQYKSGLLGTPVIDEATKK